MLGAELAVVCPSLGRPASAARLARAFAQTCTARTALVLVVSGQDAPGYREALADCPQVHGALLVAPEGVQGSGFVAPVNWGTDWVLENARPFAVGFMGDDHLPRTRGWDEAYLTALGELGTGYTWGDDLIQGEAISTQIAMTSDIPEAFGFFANPICKHLFSDCMWRDLGKAAGCARYLGNVVVEHMHYSVGRSECDDTYRIGNSGVRWTEDPATYQEWLHGEGFQRDLAILRRVMEARR